MKDLIFRRNVRRMRLNRLSSLINDYIEDYKKVFSISGNVLVSIKDEVLYNKSFGFANLEHEIPNNLDSKFRIASLTKQFTAALILLLHQKGKLNVYDKLKTYLPDLPNSYKNITIHHLLSHSSGVPDFYASVPDFMKKEDKISFETDEFMSLYINEPLNFEPGTDWSYSNSGYHLLGVLTEKITGKTFDVCLKENILSPLEMSNTGFDNHSQIIKNRASGYILFDEHLENSPYAEMTNYHASGGLYSTTGDLHIWQQALFNKNLLSEECTNLMFTSYKGNYGYGWFIEENYSRPRVFHSGSISGFTSHIVRYLDDQLCIVALGNGSYINWHSLAENLAALIFGEPLRQVKTEPFPLTSETLDLYLGIYESTSGPPGRKLYVTKKAEKIYFQWNENKKFEVYPISENSFQRVSNYCDEVHTFKKENDSIRIYEYCKKILN